MGQLLTREKLLTKEKLRVEKVVFDDGDFVYVRGMTGHERDQFERTLMRPIKVGNRVRDFETAIDDFRAKVAVYSVCDEKGTLLLKPEDVTKLSNMMSAKKLAKIAEASQELNAISEEDKETMVKNFNATQPAGSSSDSAEK